MIFMFTEDISIWMNKKYFSESKEQFIKNDFTLCVIFIQHEQTELAVSSSFLSAFAYLTYLLNLNEL